MIVLDFFVQPVTSKGLSLEARRLMFFFYSAADKMCVEQFKMHRHVTWTSINT